MFKYYRKYWQTAFLVFAHLIKLVATTDIEHPLCLGVMYALLVITGSLLLKLELYLLATNKVKFKKFLNRLAILFGGIFKLLS